MASPTPGAVVTVTLYDENFRLWDKYKVAQRGIVTKVHDDPKLIDAMVSVNGVMVEKARIPHESIAAAPVGGHPYWSSWSELPA